MEKLESNQKTLKTYRDAITAVKISRGYISGTGVRKYKQKKRNAYKIENDKYGGLFINVPRLMNEMVVEVQKKGGNIVYENRGDKSLIDLLTKRFNPKKKIFCECNTNF